MEYIEDIWPRQILDDKKFRTFLELCKIRDDFLKSLTTVRYCDYLIDKKLAEAGGLGKKVYIYLAIGTNRNISCKRIVEFLEEGRDVTIMNARDAFMKPPKNYIFDPCWVMRPDGSMWLREISVIPDPMKGDNK